MTTSDILAVVALGFSLVSALYTVFVYKRECDRTRKHATLDAFNTLQEQVLDELAGFRPNELQLIAENRRKKDTKPQYNHCKTLIARIEHFAIGIEEQIYDYETVNKLAAEHLIYLYRNLNPLILAVREYATGVNTYIHFEELVKRLRSSNPEINPYLVLKEKDDGEICN